MNGSCYKASRHQRTLLVLSYFPSCLCLLLSGVILEKLDVYNSDSLQQAFTFIIKRDWRGGSGVRRTAGLTEDPSSVPSNDNDSSQPSVTPGPGI